LRAAYSGRDPLDRVAWLTLRRQVLARIAKAYPASRQWVGWLNAVKPQDAFLLVPPRSGRTGVGTLCVQSVNCCTCGYEPDRRRASKTCVPPQKRGNADMNAD
jgi:hypothetical protein